MGSEMSRGCESSGQHPCISRGIIQSISEVWRNHELFEDFKVIVDGDIYTCHSLLLGSCSHFFRGLLRSNMKEKQEMMAELNNISSPIFQLILNSLYTGSELLTKENVLDVWSAVDQLQIQFLIEHCENCVMANLSLDTVQMYKHKAEFLQSAIINKYILYFLCANFEAFRKTEAMLELHFKDLTKIIESDTLAVSSEDEVLNFICHWVNYGSLLTKNSDAIATKVTTTTEHKDAFPNNVLNIGTTNNMEEPKEGNISSKVNCDTITQEESNERKTLLIPLIKSSRYCLASELCILRPYNDKLIQSDVLIREILFEAFTYKCSHYLHGHWPTAAIQRDCSSLIHVGVYCDTREIYAVSFKHKDKWYRIKNLPAEPIPVKLIVFKGNLYACSIGSAPNKVYVLQSDMWVWVQVTEISHDVHLLLTYENHIYLVDANEKHITRFNPESSPIKPEPFVHEVENLAYAKCFHNNIVAFSSVDNNGVEETAVHSWSAETEKVWTKLDNLKFSSQNMTSFRSDKDTYILDSNGNLLKLTSSEGVGFAFIAKLWSKNYNIKGAVLFRDTLFIFGNFPDGIDDVVGEVEGLCSSTYIVWGLEDRVSNVVHYVIHSSELEPV